jgi:hypothetical protein
MTDISPVFVVLAVVAGVANTIPETLSTFVLASLGGRRVQLKCDVGPNVTPVAQPGLARP